MKTRCGAVKNLTIVEARNNLTKLPEQLNAESGTSAVTVTRRGRPVMAVMSHDLYESIMETMEIMSDPEAMAVLRQSILEADNGQVTLWQNVKEENGL